MKVGRLIIAVALMALVGCSGGEGDPVITQVEQEPVTQPPAPTPPLPVTPPKETPKPSLSEEWKTSNLPVGIWRGMTGAEQRSVLGVVMPRGETWFVYSVIGAPQRAGGVIRGNMTVEGSTWSMKGASYLDETYEALATISASGTWISGQRITGWTSVTAVPPDHQKFPKYSEDSVNLIYDNRSLVPFDLATAAGTYAGLWYPTEEVVIELRESGVIKGVTASGCTFTGQATPDGPVATGAVTFDGPPCENGTATVRGVIGVDLQTGTLYAAGFNADKDKALLFIGKR